MKTPIKYFTALAIGSIMASPMLLAETVDTTQAQKDMRIMQGIIESSIEASKTIFPSKPRISSTYLAEQGYLFTIKLSRQGAYGVTAWDNGRLELDIPEIIENAFAAVDYATEVAPEDPEVMMELQDLEAMEHDFENAYNRSAVSKEYQDKLKRMREEQRELRRETYQLSREVRKAEDEKQRQALRKKLETVRNTLEKSKQSYKSALVDYKKERINKQIASTDKAVDSILQTLCDYGQTMKGLEDSQKFNLMLEGAVSSEGDKVTQIFVFDAKAIKSCKSIAKLRKNALYYSL